jgi:hypothetical protein
VLRETNYLTGKEREHTYKRLLETTQAIMDYMVSQILVQLRTRVENDYRDPKSSGTLSPLYAPRSLQSPVSEYLST